MKSVYKIYQHKHEYLHISYILHEYSTAPAVPQLLCQIFTQAVITALKTLLEL